MDSNIWKIAAVKLKFSVRSINSGIVWKNISLNRCLRIISKAPMYAVFWNLLDTFHLIIRINHKNFSLFLNKILHLCISQLINLALYTNITPSNNLKKGMYLTILLPTSNLHTNLANCPILTRSTCQNLYKSFQTVTLLFFC